MDYRHVDKDPVIDALRTIIEDAYGDITHSVLERLSYDSGVSVHCLRGWFLGETRRPFNMTVRLVLQALNCRVQIIRADGTEIIGMRNAYRKEEKKINVNAKTKSSAASTSVQ